MRAARRAASKERSRVRARTNAHALGAVLRGWSSRSSMTHDVSSASDSICRLVGCPSIADRHLQSDVAHEVRCNDGWGEQTPRPTPRRVASGPLQHESHPPTDLIARCQSRSPTVSPAVHPRGHPDRPDSAPSQLSSRSDAAHRSASERAAFWIRDESGKWGE